MRSFLIFPFLLLFLFSCEDEGNFQHNLEGRWSLISYECCSLPAENYDGHQIVWDFDTENQRVDFTSNVEFGVNSQYSFKEDGSYDFDLEGSEITIEYHGRSYSYHLDISGRTLALSDRPESDGPLLKFRKL